MSRKSLWKPEEDHFLLDYAKERRQEGITWTQIWNELSPTLDRRPGTIKQHYHYIQVVKRLSSAPLTPKLWTKLEDDYVLQQVRLLSHSTPLVEILRQAGTSLGRTHTAVQSRWFTKLRQGFQIPTSSRRVSPKTAPTMILDSASIAPREVLQQLQTMVRNLRKVYRELPPLIKSVEALRDEAEAYWVSLQHKPRQSVVTNAEGFVVKVKNNA